MAATVPPVPARVLGMPVGPSGPFEVVDVVDTPEGVAVDFVLAGLGSRALARMLDSVVQYAMLWGISIPTNAAFSTLHTNSGWLVALVVIVQFAVLLGYDIVFELLGNGQTVGKRALGIQVVRSGGRPVDLRSSLVRNLLRLIDMFPNNYLVGSVTVFCSSRNQRLGDMAGGTVVVRVRRGDTRSWQHAHAALATVPAADVALWDTTRLPPGELQLVRDFLARRIDLTPAVRAHLASQLEARVRRHVTGVAPGVHPEYVLEGVVVAKDRRS